MGTGRGRGSREQRKIDEVREALTASLDLHAVLSDAYDLLLPLVGASYGALAVNRSGRADEDEWIVHKNLSPAFLGAYAEMAPHDFVRSAVTARINRVVRDDAMIDRRAFERNMMYHRAREVGSPIEHVMAVMLYVDGGSYSGLSLYRKPRQPFSLEEEQTLQQLTPAFANAVRNCRLYASAKGSRAILETLLGSRGSATICVQLPARELERTALATSLLEAWFSPVERGAGGLPRPLLEALVKAQIAHGRGQVTLPPWTRQGNDATLEVELLPLPQQLGESVWALMLRVVPRSHRVPAKWERRLTKRQRQVVAKMLLGWDNEEVASELSIELSTVKKHVQHIFDRLGVQDRKRLLYQATLDP